MGCRWCERQELQPSREATPSLCKTTSENTGTKHNQKKTKNRKKHNHHRNFYVDRLSTGVMCCFPLPVCFSLLFVSFAWSPGPCVSFVFPLCSPWHVVCLEFFSLDFCILFFALRVFRHWLSACPPVSVSTFGCFFYWWTAIVILGTMILLCVVLGVTGDGPVQSFRCEDAMDRN